MVAAVLLSIALLASACGSSGSGDAGSGGSTGSTGTSAGTGGDALGATPAYEAAGPYVPGVTTLDLDGRKVEVWYPADKGAEAGKPKDVFRISTLLPDNLKSVIPDALDPKYETDAYRDITASAAGPFPVVLFSHGYAAYPTLYAFLLTHLASWGFVVVAPDHVERGLLAAVTQCTKVADDAKVLLAARDLAVTKSNDPTSVLSGTIDPSKVAVVGHSAGASAAVRTALDPSVATFVALDGGGIGGSGAGTTPTTDANGCVQQTTTSTGDGSTTTTAIDSGALPDKPGMLITGGNDQVIPLSRLQPFYDAMNAPKRLVVIEGAGHNSVTDICLIGKDQGGLLAIAGKVGIAVPDTVSRLFDDGCDESGGYPAVQQVWEVPRHFIVAQLRDVFGIDPEPVGLGPGIADAFAPLQLDYRSTD